MSRKYLNDKWCVRCGRKVATPYLRKNEKLLKPTVPAALCVDVGCGNGRNSAWAKNLGYEVVGLDMAGGNLGETTVITALGAGQFPVDDESVDLVLANFVFMFLSPKERTQVCREIMRVARSGCKFVVELYAAKDSYAKTVEESLRLQKHLRHRFVIAGWDEIRYSKERFILQRR